MPKKVLARKLGNGHIDILIKPIPVCDSTRVGRDPRISFIHCATFMREILEDNARPEAGELYPAIDVGWAVLVGQIAKAYGK
jgi:hypothetical protein